MCDRKNMRNTKERVADFLLDNMCERDGVQETIIWLLDSGFTYTELVYELNFNKDEVEHIVGSIKQTYSLSDILAMLDNRAEEFLADENILKQASSVQMQTLYGLVFDKGYGMFFEALQNEYVNEQKFLLSRNDLEGMFDRFENELHKIVNRPSNEDYEPCHLPTVEYIINHAIDFILYPAAFMGGE
jgi:hypothetical protein